MAAKKSVAAKVAKASETKVASSDVIFSTAQEVENLTATKAFSMVEELSNDIEQNSFKLGGALSLIASKCESGDEAFLADHGSFKDLCLAKFNLHYRKAMYLIGIYRNLVEHSIPYDAVKGIGWTKIALLAPILTAKNVDSWVKKAQKMTYLQLQDAVKAKQNAGSDAKEKEGEDTSDITTLTFKLKKDQKDTVREAIDKVKEETSTEFDSVALTHIATAVLGGSIAVGEADTDAEAPAKPKKMTKAQRKAAFIAMATEMGQDDAFEAIGEAFPDVQIDITVPE